MALEYQLGYIEFLLLYFVSLIGGSLLSLMVHSEHADYSAIGVSGAISGVILASIVLFPEGEISFVILPFSVKSWIFALLFIAISIWGIKSQSDNIGHEAHLGGGICGVLMTILLNPSVLSTILNKIPTISVGAKKPSKSRKQSNQQAIDNILDKIKTNGINSLSAEEKALLDKLSE